MEAPERLFRAFVMDRPLLYPLVERLRADERLPAFAAALPARARVSEAALPLLLAALHEELGRGLVVLVAEDADARDVAEAVGWFVGEERVGLLPVARGAAGTPGSSRRPISSASGPARSRCSPRVASSALGGRVGGTDRRRRKLVRATVDRVGRRRAGNRRARRVARARGLRARRASRGAGPVRGSRRPARRLSDDRAVSRCGSSSSATRSSRSARSRRSRSARSARSTTATIYRGRRAAPRARRDRRSAATRSAPVEHPRRPRAGASAARRTSSGSPTRCARSGARRASSELPLDRRRRARPAAAADSAFSFDAQRPALAARGLSEAENELARAAAPGARRRSSRSRIAARPSASASCCGASRRSMLAPGRRACGAHRSRSAPARRGFVWRELGVALLPDTQVFRRRPPACDGAGRPRARRASPICAPATTSSTRTTASPSCSGSRRRRSRASRATTCCSASAATTASMCRTSRSARSPATSAPTRTRRRSRSSAASAWDNLKSRAREHLREMAGELLALYAQRQTRPGIAYDVEHEWLERLEADFPYRETEDQAPRDRGGQGGSRGAAPDGPARLRRRRLRQDRGRAARRLHRRRRRASRC